MIYKDKYCHYRATHYLCIESLPFLYYFSCMVHQIIEKHIGPVAATIKKSRASQVDKRIVILVCNYLVFLHFCCEKFGSDSDLSLGYPDFDFP